MFYYEYWGLHKPPFDNVPDPSMYVDSHPSMENALAEALFAIEEGNECLAVIVGDVGLGKTLTLRMIIDSLDPEKFNIALVTNPSISFTQLMQEMIGQLTGTQCLEKRKAQLLELFNRTIYQSSDAGKKVVLLIDEANAMASSNLENLRLLTNMQDDRRNLFTIVLAGQVELARKLEHPKRQNLYQRIGTYSRIQKMQSEDLVKAYVEKRIALAGGRREIFSEDAYPFIYEHSAQGVPRLINKICKLSLKAGETNHYDRVTGELIHQIGQRFEGLAAPVSPKRKPRKKLEVHPSPAREATAGVPAPPPPEAAPPPVLAEPLPIPEMLPAEPPAVALEAVSPAAPASLSAPAPAGEAVGLNRPGMEAAPVLAEPIVEPEAPPSKPAAEELEINAVKIHLPINPDLIAEAQSSTEEFRVKLAGVLAAQALKNYPELTASPAVDPVNIWSEIRGHVLKQFDYAKTPLAY